MFVAVDKKQIDEYFVFKTPSDFDSDTTTFIPPQVIDITDSIRNFLIQADHDLDQEYRQTQDRARQKSIENQRSIIQSGLDPDTDQHFLANAV